jgi:hypothetical protein
VARGDSCLVVVGRGTTDPDANSEIAKLTRMLEEGMGFGASFVCYSGTARPLVADGLKAASLLGFERIVVLPYFLFDGVLVKRIYGAVDDLAARCPDIEVLAAPYLGVHEHVAEVFLERAQEGVEGRASMNCSLCKYRVQIIGFEQQVGTPQQGHHGKVRGLLAKDSSPAAAPPGRPMCRTPSKRKACASSARGATGRPFRRNSTPRCTGWCTPPATSAAWTSCFLARRGRHRHARPAALPPHRHRCHHGGNRPQARGAATAGSGNLVRRARPGNLSAGRGPRPHPLCRRHPPRLGKVWQ